MYFWNQPLRKLRSPIFVFKPALVGTESEGSGDFKVTIYE